MKSKLIAAVLLASSLIAALPVEAGSIGRSSSSSSSSRSSSSSSASRSSSYSAPSRPAPSVAPAPSKPGGIGGNTASMGVRKPEVTAPVQSKVDAAKPTAPSTATAAGSTSVPHSAPAPTYGSAPTQPVVIHSNSGGGGGFGSSFAGALGGSMLGNALFANHGSGTTVVNNGGGGYAQGQPVAQSSGGYATGPTSQPGPSGEMTQQKEEYGMWHFMFDMITFVILVAMLVGIAWLFYKGYKMVKGYVDKERGIVDPGRLAPTAQFWKIQKAFADADVARLQTLLGPDLVDELTLNLEPTTLTLTSVSHEVVLDATNEFSVHYTFVDDGSKVNQVWHYEKHNGSWVLNGIENIN